MGTSGGQKHKGAMVLEIIGQGKPRAMAIRFFDARK
jgi:hypothetical protein